MEGHEERQPGALTALPNGVSSTENESTPQSTHKMDTASSTRLPQHPVGQLDQLPPELRHITEGYVPLSRLFDRVAQTTSNDLQTMLAELTDLNERDVHQANGDVAHRTRHGDQKRLRILEFADNSRARFMKLFVMLKWAQSTREDIGKLIDLRDYLLQGVFKDQGAQDGLMWLAKDLAAAHVPGPAINDALRILSDADQSQLSDLGYIPKEPLSAKKLSEELDRINILLHIRLNLHETLPKPLQKFSIANGRVTFNVQDAFEMDLSILDEEPSSRWYFIDFRLLFQPCAKILSGQLRYEVEFRLNSILASQGLTACFEFLQDYVLTYKLSVLRRQALELTKGAWNGHLRVERIRRSLILHYWIQRPAKKSWVEIGVQSGKKTDGAASEMEHPTLSVRWFRNGVQVPGEEVPLLADQNLDVESLLDQVVNMHIRHALHWAYAKIENNIAPAIRSTLEVVHPKKSKSACHLVVPLYSTPEAELRIESVTGSFAVKPVSDINLRTSAILDTLRNPSEELAQAILDWRQRDAIGTLQSAVQESGWVLVIYKNFDLGVKRHLFGDAQAALVAFRHWQNRVWTVAACPDGKSGYHFWLLESDIMNTQNGDLDGSHIKNATKLPIDGRTALATALRSLERVSIAMVSSNLLCRQLATIERPTKAHFALPMDLGRWPSRQGAGPARTDHDIFPPQTISLGPGYCDALVSPYVVFSYQGQDKSAPTEVLHLLSAEFDFDENIAQLASLVSSDDVVVSEDGKISILERVTVGNPDVAAWLLRNLFQVMFVYRLLRVLRAGRMEVTNISMNAVTFVYAQEPRQLSATLRYRPQTRPSLAFFPHDNPHHRINHLFDASFLQGGQSQSMKPDHTILALPGCFRRTLPVLQALIAIEEQRGCTANFSDVSHCTLQYGRPQCRIDIDLQWREAAGEGGWWHISDHASSPTPGTRFDATTSTATSNQELHDSLKDIYTNTVEENVMSLRHSICAKPRAIYDLLMKVDQAIRQCADAESAPEPTLLADAVSIVTRKPTQKQDQPGGSDIFPVIDLPIPPQNDIAPQEPAQQPHRASIPMIQSRSQGSIDPPSQTNNLKPLAQPMTQSRSHGAPGGPPPRTSYPPTTNGQIPSHFPLQLPPHMQAQNRAQGNVPMSGRGGMNFQRGQRPGQQQQRGPPQDVQSLQAQQAYMQQLQGMGLKRGPQEMQPGQEGPRKMQKVNGLGGAQGSAQGFAQGPGLGLAAGFGMGQTQGMRNGQNQQMNQMQQHNQTQNQSQAQNAAAKNGKGKGKDITVIDLD